MNHIEKHEELIELLETIRHAERRIAIYDDTIQSFGSWFPALFERHVNKRKSTIAARERLIERYNRLITNLPLIN